MIKNKFSELIYTEDDICSMLMSNIDLDLGDILVNKEIKVHDLSDILDHIPHFVKYNTEQEEMSVETFDQLQQSNWYMPQQYKDMDIAKYVLDQCNNDAELQRVGEELLLFVQHDLMDLLKYLKYLVDLMRENNIVWGVGRGSSVASFVLFLIGIHKVNSMYYDLDPTEFLR